jgi:AhpD family alkylhydroperoxidase
MSWIITPETHPYPWYVRFLFAILRPKGLLTEPVRLWARSPRVFLAFLRIFKAVDRASSPLEPALRSLVMVRVAQVNVCPFCVDLNGSRALERGVSEEKLLALPEHETSPLFSEREKVALAFADAVTVTGSRVRPELRERLTETFPDDTIVELNALVAFQNMSAKFNVGLDVAPVGFCRIPARTAAPASAES